MRIALLLPPFFIFVITLGFWWAVILMIIIIWIAFDEKKKNWEQILKDNEEARLKCKKAQLDRIRKLSDEFNKPKKK